VPDTEIHAFHDHALRLREHAEDLALLAVVVPSDHADHVALLDVKLMR
jgi:hypothetical protein